MRHILAPNPSALTLDGTRTYLIGTRRLAVIDPGPAVPAHVDALAAAAADAMAVSVLLTHRHPDHAAGAAELGARLGAPVRSLSDHTLWEGASIETDAGELRVLATPGHTPDHVAFHWAEAEAVFCGDLMLGGHDTALVAPPEGDLGRYLDSLGRLAALGPAIIYPAHGGPFTDPAAAIERYVRHRLERESRIITALEPGPAAEDDLLARVYGAEIPPELVAAARAALPAYLEHLHAAGRIRRVDGGWTLGGPSGADG